MPHELPEDDPIVLAIVEDALDAYAGELSPEGLADARELVTLYVTTHPEMVALVDSLRPRPAMASSGDVDGARKGAVELVRSLGLRSGGSR